MGRFLVGGVVVDDAGNPVPPSDPYYYNAAEDVARQIAEQEEASRLAGMQAANQSSLNAGSDPPFPDALTDAQRRQWQANQLAAQQELVTVRDPREALGAVASGGKWLMIAAGALVLLAVARRGQR